MLIAHVGPMYSGKTTALCTELSKLSKVLSKKPVLYINHTFDTRSESCSSHLQAINTLILDDPNIKKLKCEKLVDLKVEDLLLYSAVGVDEAQFFTDLDIIGQWLEYNITVIVAGLHKNYRQESFGKMTWLLNHADRIYHHTAYCQYCGDQNLEVLAAHTVKLIRDEREVLVGGKAVYQVVCRAHYQLLSNLIESN